MKKFIMLLLAALFLFALSACSSTAPAEREAAGDTHTSIAEESQDTMTSDTDVSGETTAEKTEDSVSESGTMSIGSTAEPEKNTDVESEHKNPAGNQPETISAPETQKPADTSEPATEKPNTSSNPVTELSETTKEPATAEPSISPKEEEPMKQAQFYIIAGETTFTADFADNSSADAFRELLTQGDLTINMNDYGSFEKVGSIGQSLPREDTQISTTIGDVILYQGNQIVIFYGTNSWSYSRLGKIQNAAKDDLLTAFGSGNVTITFSLTK